MPRASASAGYPTCRPLVRASTAASAYAASCSRQRAPTPLLPAIRALSRAGDNDTDDAATLQKRRLGLSSRDLSSLGLRPSTGMRFHDLGLKSFSEGNLVPFDSDDSMRSTAPSRTGGFGRLSRLSERTGRSAPPSGWGSSTGSRAPTARLQDTLARHRLGTPMLEGISRPVEMQNEQLEDNIELLYTQVEEEAEGAEHPCSTGLLSPERSLLQSLTAGKDFMFEADATMRMIKDMHDEHQDFSPGKTWMRKKSTLKGMGDDQDEGGEEDKRARLLERLEYYKMAKRFDPDPLPPLTPAGVTSRERLMTLRIDEPKPRAPEMIEYNLSEEAIKHWAPRERKERLLLRKDEGKHHVAEVINAKECLLKLMTDKWSENLKQKHLRAEAAGDRKVKAQADETAQQWLMICTVTSFLHRALAGLGQERELQRVQTGRESLAMSDTMSLLEANPQCQTSFALMAVGWRYRKKLAAARHGGQALHKCLLKWNRAPCGSMFIQLKAYANLVRKLQAWWRTTSKRLHDIRDAVSRRWEFLEHGELVSELAHKHAMGIQTPSPKNRNLAKRQAAVMTGADEPHFNSPPPSRQQQRRTSVTADTQLQLLKSDGLSRKSGRVSTLPASSVGARHEETENHAATVGEVMGKTRIDLVRKKSRKMSVSLPAPGGREDYDDAEHLERSGSVTGKLRKANTFHHSAGTDSLDESGGGLRKSTRVKTHHGASGADRREDGPATDDAAIEDVMIHESTRLCFIEHELRARRYLLLPEISMWREELKKWQDDELQSRTSGVPAFFRMPPTRPSYLPLRHLHASAVNGTYSSCAECSKWCEGKRGDKLILKWRGMLRSGEGWTEIPTSESIKQARKKPAQAERAATGSGTASNPESEQQQSLFGRVAEEEDLQKWGIDIKGMGMPGLDRRGENSETMPIVYFT